QVVGDVEHELVRGAEASGALGGADHDRARVVHEASPAFSRVDGTVKRGYRVRVPLWSEARDDVEVIQVAGGDHHVVECVLAPRGCDLLRLWIDRRRLAMDELNPARLERLGDGVDHVLLLPLPEGDPDERRVELEAI